MGILTEGAIVSEVRGSVGSRTFSKNAYGPYVKNKLIQTNPNTAKQQGKRSTFRNAVQAWQALTDDQRKLWRNWALENPTKNSLGKQVVLSGFNMFISCYMNKSTVGALSRPFLFTKRRWPAQAKGFIGGYEVYIYWEFQWVVSDPLYNAAIYIAPQQHISKWSVNPSDLRLYGNQPASGFGVIEFSIINDLMGFPPYQQSPDLFTPLAIKPIDIDSGLAAPMYIFRLQSIPDGYIR